MALLKRLARMVGLEAPLTQVETGKQAPDFFLKALDGKEYSLSAALEHGPVVLVFFKISCPVCQFTMPFLQRLYERYGSESGSFLGISQDDVRSTKAFNQEYGVKFPTLIDEDGYPASNAYGLTNVPTVLLIAPDGTATVSGTGFSKADLEKIAEELAQRRKVSLSPLFRQDEVVPAFKPG